MSRYVNDQNQSEVIYLALSTVSGVGRRHLSVRCQRYELHFISLRLRNLYSYFKSRNSLRTKVLESKSCEKLIAMENKLYTHTHLFSVRTDAILCD